MLENLNSVKFLSMNKIAEAYVKLVLKIGLYDPDYIDAYYGPEEWRPKSKTSRSFPYAELNKKATNLLVDLNQIDSTLLSDFERLRLDYLEKHLKSAKAKIELLNGNKFAFDEECHALYDATAQVYAAEYFESKLEKLNSILPGSGSISERFKNFSLDLIVPKERLESVFEKAVAECRKRTRENIELPENENFRFEFVSNQPWAAYNWYKGNSFSLIQVNADFPFYIDSAITLAAHEGYPGHHVNTTLQEQKLKIELGWPEFSVFVLFSPYAVIYEGCANFSVDVVFPGDERKEFELAEFLPLTNGSQSEAEKYYEIQKLRNELNTAETEAAREYLDGNWTRKQVKHWLGKYSLRSGEDTEAFVNFIERYRSYAVTYTVGENLVRTYIKRNMGKTNRPEKRWQLFAQLLSTPQTPSGIAGNG